MSTPCCHFDAVQVAASTAGVVTFGPEVSMMRKALFLTALIALLAAGVLGAQEKGDSRVSAALDRLELKYTLTKNGNYSVTYDLDGGRSQVAYVVGSTETYNGVEIRELWSRAGTLDAAPTSEVMEKLLLDSGTEKIGAWNLEKSSSGGYIVYYSVRIPVSTADDSLKSLLELTAKVADQKEEELFSVDDE